MSYRMIADSGSTKTDWAVCPCCEENINNAEVTIIQTQGINPLLMTDDDILGILTHELAPYLQEQEPVTTIQFYGSGVRPDQEQRVEQLLSMVFTQTPQRDISAKSDLLGAARALCGHQEGIACILGTGANSCLYDGRNIVKNVPPMGYVLGDEGSGAVLGKLFLNALYKGRLSQFILHDFESTLNLSLSSVIDRVYRQPLPNRWLASLSAFIHQYVDDAEVRALVIDNFRDFIRNNVARYQRSDLPLHAVGSIAFFYSEQLREAACKEDVTLGTILRSPIEGLVHFKE